MTSAAMGRTVAVVVAYNRRDLLIEVLDALAEQTTQVGAVVVVDNASTDDTAALVREHYPTADLVSVWRNTGGAGGFAIGAARAVVRQKADFVWLMDDDTVPTNTALEALLHSVGDDHQVTVAGSRVVWTDGRDHPMNTPRVKPFVRAAERAAAGDSAALPVRSSSFVSMLVRAEAVLEHGLPIADYFIWNDDFEFSTRLLRRSRGYFVPSSVVVHKTLKLGATDVDPGERFYYEVRNKIWLLRCSRGLSPAEKVLYSGSSLRRWARTFRASTNRPVLMAGLRRGIRDGFRTRPRPNAIALAGLGEATDDVAACEAGVPRA
ncbi:rhamnopyranosyl-N-acetylglucosaminyl-diphospho-decaprenol beta-1,3/1,4-galactofuranosyltransferase [Cryobacterium sp. MP_M5]|uniref:glycosyltransferase n=1 Tax=unclassified Cryobacterium TaxID=2649013 RepID=UPI0018CB3E60|nr:MULTISPECIES: glycosyltransferase [unclassified Cryobacterium]MBG6058523.1 GT2 family glycosyltransferase [Cryobacterium sp. MP_M3]MEC5178275.1 rhamnopyranosyl-N-acetylglucosaminyl-diphospho-decaprenol beta-1,3/1,4-galactofuranosyltransferase [Cryobacterium sp. MP_M5]